MAEKYIDLGKAVYHFAMPVMPPEKNAEFGIVREEYKNGLTSFDYERVKATESMERNVTIAVTCALKNFSSSALKKPAGKTTDVLFLKDDQLEDSLYEDTGRRILRYFGGASQWTDNKTVSSAASGRGDDLFKEIKKQIASLRNGSYHYTQKYVDVKSNIVSAMLDSEKAWIGPIIRKKYYSNNTHWFYPQDDLNSLIKNLYTSPAIRVDQIPAFSNLFNRNTLFEEEKIFTPEVRGSINSLGNEKAKIFKGAAFFLFKEIYYYSFLKEKDIAKVFRDLVFSRVVQCDNWGALKNFRNRIAEIRYGAPMGEIAQVIMTDYNLQNQQKETAQIISSDQIKEDKEKYKSFPMILYKYMGLTFLDFLEKNKEKYGFLYDPKEQASQIGIKEEDFCTEKDGLEVEMFRKLDFAEAGKKSVAAWYVLGHMIPPSQLNHLSGDLRNYIRYLGDLDRRANQTGNKNANVNRTYQKECDYFERVLEVLEFCRFFCGNTSKQYTDYYPEGTYTEEIFRYVDIKNHLGAACNVSDEKILAAFCDQKTGYKNPDGTAQKIKLFHDGKNLILNRNMVLASLYGTDRIIPNAIDKVTETDIFEYYKLCNTLMQNNAAEQMDIKEKCRKNRELQNRKNHIELVNVKVYSDILNDLMVQMISWAYFRERDQMYLALGTQYLRLYFGSNVKADSLLRNLSWKGTVDGKTIDVKIEDGAVLYQIAALYTYHLPLYEVEYDAAGRKIDQITEHTGMAGSKQKYYDMYLKNQDAAQATNYFFEVAADSKQIRNLRNYIDHFRYFVKADRSILDLYSDIYNIFFSYSENYRKSVTFILPNILSRYFVLTGLHMDKQTRQVTNANNVSVSRNGVRIDIDDELKSYQLTYNIEEETDEKGCHYEKTNGEKAGAENSKKEERTNALTSGANSEKKKIPVKVDARDKQFLKDVKQILYYRTR